MRPWGGCERGAAAAHRLPPPPRAPTRRPRRDLAAAIWRPHLGVAEVVLQRGKLFTHMGFTQGSKQYLFVEEAT